MVPLALVGLALALLTAAFMKAAEAFFGRLKERVVLRALVAGAIFSVVGLFAPVVMFSGETQVQTVIKGAAGYGIALLLVMAVGKLALLAVGFSSGFLGGPTFPLIFASVSVALALNLVFPGVPIAILVAGIMTGAVYALFRTPLMVVLLTGVHARRRPDDDRTDRARRCDGDDRHAAAPAAHRHAARREEVPMTQAIGDILPLAIGIAISPVPIIAIILMLITPKARSNGLAFLGGWLLGLAVVGTVVLIIANTAGVATSSGPSKTVSAISSCSACSCCSRPGDN